MIKIICTTSNRYLHLIPVFCYLFNRYWSNEQEVTILGYEAPKCELPANFKFHSMGTQGPVNEWSTDLRKYFEGLEETHWIWLMEDCFIKRANIKEISELYSVLTSGKNDHVGRYDLTGDVQKRPHDTVNGSFIRAKEDTEYRLSTQASIWNKKFLLQYLTDGLTPWIFEKQEAKNDGWDVLGMIHPPFKNNEGVRKHNPHELDLNGFSDEDVTYIKSLL